MLRYAITDLSTLPAGPGLTATQTRRLHWHRGLERWTAEGVEFIQLREKLLDAGELFELAHSGMAGLLKLSELRSGRRPLLLLNSRPDVAAAARTDGVHLSSRVGELTPGQVRRIFREAGLPDCIVSQSCHSLPEVESAVQEGADLLLFGPVFGKTVNGENVRDAAGLPQLSAACRAAGSVPVFALGGVSRGNTAASLDAGAAGVAGIRLFRGPTHTQA